MVLKGRKNNKCSEKFKNEVLEKLNKCFTSKKS